MTRVVGAVYVDNGEGVIGELRLDHNNQVVWSLGPRWDPGWRTFDSAGHFHAASGVDHKVTHPTLLTRTRHVDCDCAHGGDDFCDGYDETDYFCRICDEEIEPGLIHGEHSTTISNGYDWTVIVQSYVEGEQHTVRFETDHRVSFGIARCTDRVVESGGSARTTLVGVSELGYHVKEATRA
jgi:hypothetical protein